MKQALTGLLVGAITGALTVVMIQRLGRAMKDEDLERLSERIADQLAGLEERLIAAT